MRTKEDLFLEIVAAFRQMYECKSIDCGNCYMLGKIVRDKLIDFDQELWGKVAPPPGKT